MYKKTLIALAIGLICVPATVFAAGKARYEAGVAAVMESDSAETEEEAENAEADGAIIINEETDAESESSAEEKEDDATIDSSEDLAAGAGSARSIEEAAEILEENAGDNDESVSGYDNLGIAKVDDNLNVREKADGDSDLVGKMRKNSACEILETDGEWAYVKSGSVKGYVKAEYLLTGEEAIERAKEVETLMAKVNTTTLYVREEANTDSRVLTMVPMDEELEIVEGGEGDEWLKIEIDEDEGYVSAEYINIIEKLETAISIQELKYGEGVSDVRVSIVNYAKQFLGNPYVWGGTSLTKGADCSGYVQSVFRHFNISLPRTSAAQSTVGTKVSASEMKPGDLVFYAKYGRVNHVAIYIGNGQVINASSPKTGIKISNTYYRTPVAIRRVIKD